MAASAFLHAAERLDRVILNVKAQQFARTGEVWAICEDSQALHPEEAWAKRYATHALRPAHDLDVGPPPFSAFAAPCAQPQNRPAEPPPPSTPALAPPAVAGGHIGAGLGKAGPRKSWISKLFGGR